ncbi:MAG TPA: SMI1/KNR4 family protein [Kofleriaceae bacterium]|nr:SMI1/KNR4 family protein [Kofleriaceae bacterium]
MTIRLEKKSRGADEKDLTGLRAVVGDAHPDWMDFLRENNGAVPENNVFDIEPDNAAGITRFWSAREVMSERKKLADRMSPDLLAIADAEGGNHVCLGLSGGKGVFFWDHEVEATTRMADSFSAFLEQLRPFDPASVEVGEVISAWIDPAFLEKQKKK